LRLDRRVQGWIGTALTLVGAVATLWLAATGKLTLYIHPRYIVFTVVMAVIAVIFAVAAVAVLPGQREHLDHDEDAPTTRRSRVLGWSHAALLITAALALLVVPPATLSPRMLQSRDIVSAGQRLDTTDVPKLQGSDPATFSLKDWAGLLQQGGAESVLGQDISVSGYVLDQGEEDVFFIARMTVTCCAVDAQPIGLPVYRPDWKSELRESTWIAVEGTFVEDVGRDGRHPALIQVDSLKRIDEPDNPYVF
jgi:putative membrane protein